jgi:hypothetical protein
MASKTKRHAMRPRLKREKKEVIASARRRRARFAEEYSLDFNATRAAKAVGYSARSAYSTGQRLLSNAEVIAAIEKQQKRLSERTAITAENILRELGRIAFAEFKADDVKVSDKLTALVTAGKHIGMFSTKVEVDTRSTLLSVSVSAEDLASARALVESTLRPAPAQIEGATRKVEPGEEEK